MVKLKPTYNFDAILKKIAEGKFEGCANSKVFEEKVCDNHVALWNTLRTQPKNPMLLYQSKTKPNRPGKIRN